MENFFKIMSMVMDFMKTPFTLWGHQLSLWGIFITVSVLSIVFAFISSVFDQ